MKPLLLFLTCAHQKEATTIASELLQKKLVACVKMVPVNAQFLWEGNINTAQEILLIMESVENNFEQIEQEVKKSHSYKTFVLTATKIEKLSAGVTEWIQTSCGYQKKS